MHYVSLKGKLKLKNLLAIFIFKNSKGMFFWHVHASWRKVKNAKFALINTWHDLLTLHMLCVTETSGAQKWSLLPKSEH